MEIDHCCRHFDRLPLYTVRTLFQHVGRVLNLSPMWQYFQILDPSITETFYGFVMASYSTGQIVAAPFIGWWSNRLKSVIKPTKCLFLCVLIGNIVYLTAALFSTEWRKYIILIARFMMGVSGNVLSTMTTYAATASVPTDRSRAISIITGSFAVGMFVGPALQLLVTPLKNAITIVGDFKLSIYTAPVVICCFINIFALLLLKFGFEEKYSGLINENKKDVKILPPYDKFAVSLAHFTRFSQFFIFSNLETIGAPLSMMLFALTKHDSVVFLAFMHLIMGALGFATYLLFALVKMDKYFDFRRLCIASFIAFLFMHLATFSWPFISGRVKKYSNTEFILHINNASYPEPVGCPDKFDWCDTIQPINKWLYFIAYALVMGCCWAQSNVSLATIFSKVLGPRRQSNQQSLYYTSGAIARFISPIIASHVYSANGPRLLWIVEMGLILFTIFLWIIMYTRMIPLSQKQNVKSDQKNKIEAVN